MAGVRRAGGVGGGAKGVGAGLALIYAAAVAVGGIGGCQAPAPLDDVPAPASIDDARDGGSRDDASGASPDEATTELTARGECDGKGCEPGGGSTAKMPVCAPGSPKCDPEQNGLGVFVARSGRFCLLAPGADRLCVESFVNGPDGVKARLSHAHIREKPFEFNVKASFHSEGLPPLFFPALHSITTDRGRLVLKYSHWTMGPGTLPVTVVSTATDAELPSIWIEFAGKYDLSSAAAFQLRFKHIDDDTVLADGPSPRAPIERYYAEFRSGHSEIPAGADWSPLCTDPDGETLNVSFLGGNEVDLRSAKVTRNAQAVTMSCVTGAIDTCMTWGYAPWAGEGGETRALVFGSCLQAKRAAYYVTKGDLGSYTKPGTPILLRDMYGIHNDPINDASLEAVWTSGGAKCFNLSNRRRPELLTEGHPEGTTMTACPAGVGLGVLSTGKATQSPITD
jgi:ADYC domain